VNEIQREGHVKHLRNVRWMGALAAVCAVQLACGGGEDARYGQGAANDTGLFDETTQQVQLTGCVERGVIPGSYTLTAVRTDGQGLGLGETRGTTGATTEGSESAWGDTDVHPQGGAPYATSDSYTLRAVDGTNLGDLVGQRVRVEGRFETNQAYDDGMTGTSGASRQPADPNVGMDVERPGGSVTGAGAAMPVQQLAAENIERVDGTCGSSETEIGGDPEPVR
jgi:hypothetical protein